MGSNQGNQKDDSGTRQGRNYDLGAERALLTEALRVIYNDRDSYYTRLVTWHNKTMWLLGIALLLIVAAALYHNPVLLLLGAIGGFLSRMFRVVQADKVPTDYGAFWTSLFLSPLLGALAGWSGVLLVSAMAQTNLLGDAFDAVQWDPPLTSTVVATTTPVPGADQGPTVSPAAPTRVAGGTAQDTIPQATSTVALTPEETVARPTPERPRATETVVTDVPETGTGNGVSSQVEGIRFGQGGAAGRAPFPNPITLALAFLFGFAERFLSGIAERLQGAVTPSDSATGGGARTG